MISIKLLGPLEVQRAGVDMTPSAPKLRRVLAALVLNANLLVSVDQLSEELWEDRPPPSALTTMQTYIYQLRRRLSLGTEPLARPGQQPTGGAVLMTRVGGYELRLDDPLMVDVHRFDRLVAQGRAEMDGGDLERAAQTLGDGLAMWRGPALVDVTAGRRLSVWVTQLEERRKAALERRFKALLQLDRHHALVDELGGVVRTHPTHEGFAGQLMLALHRCGQRPEALDVFRRIRRQLVEELGLEPSAALQRLHQAILADDPQLSGTPRPHASATVTRGVVPAQLPPAIPNFVGREAQFARIDELLGDHRTGLGGTQVIEVHGPPGVGKTTFAIQAAHRVRPRFPDGQFFVDLSGITSGDVRLGDVLTASLRSCGLPRGDLPTGVDELSRMFRSWTADRRVLMVIDDVVGAARLRPLLPGGSGCAVISTNRYQDAALPGAHHISLPAMSMDEAVLLFAGIAGGWRLEDEAETVKELIRICGLLPLTVRGVAARLASRPGWSAARLLCRLRFDESMLLDLAAGPSNLASTFALTYRNVPERDRHAIRMIAMCGPQSWTPVELADLIARDVRDAEALIDHLVDVHLLEEVPPSSAGDPAPSLHRGTGHRYAMPRLTALALESVIRAEEEVDGGADTMALAAAGAFGRSLYPLAQNTA
jgi:DNA-binding SARP family transcriptional activator